MKHDLHERARQLIATARVEGVSSNDREWLDAHLQSCSSCSETANATEQAIRSLRQFAVRVDPALIARTRRAVRLRSSEIHSIHAQMVPLWMSCAISWVLGGVTLPWVWRGIEWAGHYLNLPGPIEVFLLVLWWALPTLGIAVLIPTKGAKATDL